MVGPIPLYIALLFFLAALVQYKLEVSIYIFPFARLTGTLIVTKKENPNKFANTITFQVISGCFFLLLQIVDWFIF